MADLDSTTGTLNESTERTDKDGKGDTLKEEKLGLEESLLGIVELFDKLKLSHATSIGA